MTETSVLKELVMISYPEMSPIFAQKRNFYEKYYHEPNLSNGIF